MDEQNRQNLNAWLHLIAPDAAGTCCGLLAKVQAMRDSGKEIYPSQENILHALCAVAPQDVRAVITGQDPYHEPGQAMGLSFSVPEGVRLPPSLRNIFKELHSDTGCQVPQSGDLTAWTRQGVLLLNSVLTVEAHRANSHKELGWETVTGSVLHAVSCLEQPVVFICWGRQAHETLLKNAAPHAMQTVLCSTHPSPLSAYKATAAYPAFLGSKPFSRTNEWLERFGERIEWTL